MKKKNILYLKQPILKFKSQSHLTTQILKDSARRHFFSPIFIFKLHNCKMLKKKSTYEINNIFQKQPYLKTDRSIEFLEHSTFARFFKYGV